MPELDLSAIENDDLRKQVSDALAEKDQELAEATATIAELTKTEDPVEPESDEVKALVKAQSEELEKVRADLAAEQKARRTESFISKAEPLAPFIGKPDDMGPVLEELEASSPKAYAKLESAMLAAAQRSDLADLFKTLGPTGESDADPIAQRDAWVSKNRKDDESVFDARSRFWKENPSVAEDARS